jgi:hypothetical protein
MGYDPVRLIVSVTYFGHIPSEHILKSVSQVNSNSSRGICIPDLTQHQSMQSNAFNIAKSIACNKQRTDGTHSAV